MNGNPLLNMLGGNGNNNPINAMMNNNPVFKMVNMLKNGGNPMAMLNEMAGQNPQMKQVVDMMNAGNQQGLKEMAMNMAKERGTTVENIAQQLGLDLPK